MYLYLVKGTLSHKGKVLLVAHPEPVVLDTGPLFRPITLLSHFPINRLTNYRKGLLTGKSEDCTFVGSFKLENSMKLHHRRDFCSFLQQLGEDVGRWVVFQLSFGRQTTERRLLPNLSEIVHFGNLCPYILKIHGIFRKYSKLF